MELQDGGSVSKFIHSWRKKKKRMQKSPEELSKRKEKCLST